MCHNIKRTNPNFKMGRSRSHHKSKKDKHNERKKRSSHQSLKKSYSHLKYKPSGVKSCRLRDDDHPVPGRRPNAHKSFRDYHTDNRQKRVQQKPRPLASPDRYSSSKINVPKLHAKDKAFNIVSDAISYGLRAGVLKQKGKFYYLKSELKRHSSKSKVCKECSHCKVIEKREKMQDDQFASNKGRPKMSNKKPILPKTGYKVRKCEKRRDRRYYD